MKTRRHAKILELINENSIETQEELMRMLNSSGFSVTQATVSRDIKELRLMKTLSPEGNYRYTSAARNANDIKSNFDNLFKSSVTFVDFAQNMIVIKTLSGMAQAVCAAFDTVETNSVLGTLAGDDTIFIVCRTNDASLSLVAKLKKLL